MDLTTTKTLNNGVQIPVLGLGTYLANPGEEACRAVEHALNLGYRHIDTASLYGNEQDIGEVLEHSSVKREEVFITTKVWNSDQGYSNTLKAFEMSLKKLRTGYIDLYLIHWPLPESRKDTWDALLRLYDEKLCRAVGVSNYTIGHLEQLMAASPVVPAVNQVEFSPFLYQKELQDYCEKHGIFVEAYSPLTRGKKFDDIRLRELCGKYGKTPAQMMVRWTLQVGTITLPKSTKPDRIRENSKVFDFEISEDDMELMASFNEDFRVAWNPSTIP